MSDEPASEGNPPPIMVVSDGPPPALPPILPGKPPGPPGLRIGPALAATAFYVVLLMVIQSCLTVLFMLAGKPAVLGAWAMAATLALAFAATAALLPFVVQRRWSDFWPPRMSPLRAIPGVVLIALGGWIWALEIGILTERTLPMPEWIARIFQEMFSDSDPVGSFVLLVLLPPVIEETLCRGLVLESMLRRWKPWAALAASAVVFGAIHMNPWQFVYATWLGWLVGWVYLRTRSLGLCMLMHALNNGCSWLIMRLRPDWAGADSPGSAEPPESLPVPVLLAGCGLLMAGAAWVTRRTAVAVSPLISDPDSSPAGPA